MSIDFNVATQTFHLQGLDTSYIIQIIKGKYLAHLYWGKKIAKYHGSNELRLVDRPFTPNPDITDRTLSFDNLPQEYPAYGNSDFRTPAYQIEVENGSTITELCYERYHILQGKPQLENLPATYVEDDSEADTLEIELKDSVLGLTVILSYSVYRERNVITRSVRFSNEGPQTLKILRALSMNVDFQSADFDILHLAGAWAKSSTQSIYRATVQRWGRRTR
jgi:alpha-galactosidase